jgi:hypothetical protein
MKIPLLQEVIVSRDFPECNVAKGDVAFLNDYVVDADGQEGCILEIYTVTGLFVGVVTLPIDGIEMLQVSDRLSVRRLVSA